MIKNQIHTLQEINNTRILSAECKPIAELYKVTTKVSDDVYQHACNFTAWQNIYDQLSSGIFKGKVTEGWFEGIQFFEEYTNISVRQSCIVWPNSVWIGIPCDDIASEASICGKNIVSSNTIALKEGGNFFELSTPKNYRILGFVVDKNLLEFYMSSFCNNQAKFLYNSFGNLTLHVDPIKKKKLVSLITFILFTLNTNKNLSEYTPILKIFKDELMVNIIELIFSSNTDYSKIDECLKKQYGVISKIRDYIIENNDRLISVTELCNIFYVSQRTLRNYFYRTTGLSPNIYLKYIRLNAVRRELENPQSVHKTVQDAAMTWGFWHQGQFSKDYKKLFCELPSMTLTTRKIKYF